ncbi:DUF3846 domain-containing protein [Hymenobacter siberiensis]|uniref:DUF3846 domain-containing protein n=1 Tax=Hymenobacter siberiensis TaxID=2848396 RepID=UPI001C1DDF4F|nr:hypothetical protein [Hymenobacter siberiensis]
MTETQEISGLDILPQALRCPLLIATNDDKPLASISPTNGSDFELEQLYQALDCQTIEVVSIGETDMIFIIDEEGAINGDPQVNKLATSLYRFFDSDAQAAKSILFGDAILCHTTKLL